MSGTSFDLSILRRRALTLIVAILWLQVPLIGFACWAAGAGWVLPVTAALIIAAATQAVNRFDASGDQARIISGVALMVSISILVGATQGQKLQVDLHMYYFAALALLVACCDWRVIIAGAAAVAVHHIALNIALPDLIYPGGVDFKRLLLHAIILVLEAAALAWTAFTVESMFDAVSQETTRAEQARSMAEQSHLAAMALAKDAESVHENNERERAGMMREDEIILDNLAFSLSQLAEGNLTFSLDADLPKKAEGLRADFNSAVQSLRAAMLSVVNTVGCVRSGVNEISSAADNLSSRTQRQAASLEETAAALEEITATVRRTTENVRHASTVAGITKERAEQSGEVMQQAVEAMGGIERSSQQIGQIIGVIDEIAFQTNLLALNAGVEAARAGDAGRGFAVVAAEVRALAQRAAEAAKEIKALISASSAEVKHGVELVAATGIVLEQMLAQIAEINTIMAEISASAGEQTSGLDQVNAGVSQMDQVTQQNAAMVEESAAASHSLMKETEELSRLIGRFNLGHSEAAETTSTSPSSEPFVPSIASVYTLKARGKLR